MYWNVFVDIIECNIDQRSKAIGEIIFKDNLQTLERENRPYRVAIVFLICVLFI